MEKRLEDEVGGREAEEVLSRMARRLLGARAVLVTSHIHPDGDSIGSEMALVLGLRKLGKAVRLVNADPAPRKYAFLDPGGAIEVLRASGPGSLRGIDLGVLLDASEPSRVGALEPFFFGPGLERICLDHHPGPRSPLFLEHWVAPRAPATGTLILRLLDALGVALDAPIAAALFVAIATDTGWFQFSNTSSLALRDAARLLECGVEPEVVHARIYREFRPERLLLLGRLLSGIRLEYGGRFAWSLLESEVIDRSGVPLEEMDGFTEEMKGIAGAEVVAMVVEQTPGAFKVSLRSRGDLDVNLIAVGFSGGGHAKAAGFRTGGRADEVVAALARRVGEALGIR